MLSRRQVATLGETESSVMALRERHEAWPGGSWRDVVGYMRQQHSSLEEGQEGFCSHDKLICPILSKPLASRPSRLPLDSIPQSRCLELL